MSTSGRKAKAIRIQTGNHQHNEHHAEKNMLEDAILKACGVNCSVKITPDEIKIRAKTFSDYILAKAAIKGRTKLPIIRGGN